MWYVFLVGFRWIIYNSNVISKSISNELFPLDPKLKPLDLLERLIFEIFNTPYEYKKGIRYQNVTIEINIERDTKKERQRKRDKDGQ